MTCPSPQGLMVFQDSATIPCVLLPVRQQAGGLTRTLLMVTIPVSTLFLWFKIREGERIFGDLLRILTVFIVLIGYDAFFTDGVSLVGQVSQSLYPTALVLVFYEKIWQSNLLPGTVGSFVSFLSDPMGILYLVLLDGLKVLVLGFSLVRYALLSFLYIAGPILFAVAVVPGMFFLLTQWVRNTLEIALWLLFHNLLIGIFSSINLYQALSSAGLGTTLVNRVQEIGILLVLVLMVLFVPILTHLLLDRSYEGIGSFMGPQAESMGRHLWENVLARPLLKGELPFGMGEFKSGTTVKDTGQGRRVYRKKQLRIGPLDFTEMIWQRTPKSGKTPSGRLSGGGTDRSTGADQPEGSPAKRVSSRTAKSPAKKPARKASVSPAGAGRGQKSPAPRPRKKSPPKSQNPTGETP